MREKVDSEMYRLLKKHRKGTNSNRYYISHKDIMAFGEALLHRAVGQLYAAKTRRLSGRTKSDSSRKAEGVN